MNCKLFALIQGAKRSILVAFTLFTTATCFSQTTFGVHAGLNISKWKVDLKGDNSFTASAGPLSGISATIPIKGSFSVQPELTYSAFGSNADEEGTKVKYRVNYLVIPVLLKYQLPKNFSVLAGPDIAFIMSGKRKGDSGNADLNKYLVSNDLLLTVGGEYEFEKGMFAGIRYNYGLKNIHEYSATSINSRSFSLTIGYRFENVIKKKRKK